MRLGLSLSIGSVGVFAQLLRADTTLVTADSVLGTADRTLAMATGTPTIVPSASWNGTAGSGGTAPTRSGSEYSANGTSLRPEYGSMIGTVACNAQFVWPLYSDEAFFEDVQVWVAADAANSTDGITGGIAYVDFWCEGTTRRVSRQTLVSYPTWNGGSVSRPVYAVKLPWASIADGALEIYATAHSNTSGVADRTIGPLRLYRKTAWDRTIDITPSLPDSAPTRFASWNSALDWLINNYATVASETHIRLRYTEDASHDLVSFGSTNGATNYSQAQLTNFNTGRRGQILIDANGHTVTLSRSTYGNFRPGRPNRVCFKGFKIDVAKILAITGETGQASNPEIETNRVLTWYDCEFYSSNGNTELPGNTGTGKYLRDNVFSTYHSFVRCYQHDFASKNAGGVIMVGSVIENIIGDCHTISGARPFLATCNQYRDCDVTPLRQMTDRIQLSYGGAGTATWDITGTHNTNTRALVLKVNGVAVQTITASTTEGSGVYQMSDVPGAITASGWSATVLDNSIRFAMIGSDNQSFTAQPIATAVPGAVMPHADLFQFSSTENCDNHRMDYNECTEVYAQLMFFSIQVAGLGSWNVFCGNNAMFQQYELAVSNDAGSQITCDHYHLMIAHNHSPTQGFFFRLDLKSPNATVDSYTRVVNNVFLRAPFSVGTGTFNAHVHRNICYMDAAWTGANVSDNATNIGTLAADYDVSVQARWTTSNMQALSGSAQRSGTYKRAPELPYDVLGASRSNNCPPGAFA